MSEQEHKAVIEWNASNVKMWVDDKLIHDGPIAAGTKVVLQQDQYQPWPTHSEWDGLELERPSLPRRIWNKLLRRETPSKPFFHWLDAE